MLHWKGGLEQTRCSFVLAKLCAHCWIVDCVCLQDGNGKKGSGDEAAAGAAGSGSAAAAAAAGGDAAAATGGAALPAEPNLIQLDT